MQGMVWNGVPWFDGNGDTVNAHGACVVREKDTYYLFGEYKTDDKNHYNGFSCYSTKNFEDWKFEGMALAPEPGGLLGPDRIGERVKVVKSVKTGKYVMLMHTDDLNYNDPCIGVAVSDTIEGGYKWVGPLLYRGEKIRKWDMGTFTEEDGTVYLLTHEGYIYRLNPECTEAEELVARELAPGGESPAMCKFQGKYYLMFSNKTSWERNDNYYLTADDMKGPWTMRGLFCPEGSRTYNTQCSFIFDCQIGDRAVKMYLGDRWSYPRQASAATLVLLPLEFDGGEMKISRYVQAWQFGSMREWREPDVCHFAFCSNIRGDSREISFQGERIYLFGSSSERGGYAEIEVLDGGGRCVNESVLDFYSAVPMKGLKYVSPELKRGNYMLRVTVSGEGGEWFQKDGTRFGSRDCYVDLYGFCAD